MDIERALISAVVTDKNVDGAVNSGVTPALFAERFLGHWEWVLEHFREHGESPGAHAFGHAFPDFEIVEVTEGVQYYALSLRKKFAAVTAQAHMQVAAGMLRDGKDPFEIVEELRQVVLTVDDIAHTSRDIDWQKSRQDRLDRYHATQLAEDGIDGLPYPFATLNHATKGKHGGELILIVADQGVGKSWFTTLCAKADYDFGARPGIFSKEMPAWQFGRRIDALTYKLPYTDLRDGTLDTVVYQRWVDAVNAEGVDERPFPIMDDEDGGVSHVAAKAIKHKLDAVYIDGGYLMDDDRGAKSGWERFGNVTRDLKRLAKRLDIPIVITVQLNGDGDVAYFKGVERDADSVIEIRRTEDQKLLNIMEIIIRKLREGAVLKKPLEVLWGIDEMDFREIEQTPDKIESMEEEIAVY